MSREIEKENTERLLKGMRPLMTRPWLCKFGFHVWTKWDNRVDRYDGRSYTVDRVCDACNKYQKKIFEYQ